MPGDLYVRNTPGFKRDSIGFRNRDNAISNGGQTDLVSINLFDVRVSEIVTTKPAQPDITRREESLGIVNDCDILEPLGMSDHDRLEITHVVRPADHDNVVVTTTIAKKGLEERRAHLTQHFDIAGQIGVNILPVLIN